MSIKTINKMYTRDDGISNPVICPHCGKTAGMRLFSTIDTSLVAKILPDDKDILLAVCPLCSAVFRLAENYSKERAMGTTVFLTESDLEEIERR